MHPQYANILLRTCHLPIATNLLRTVHPANMLKHATTFDADMRDAYKHVNDDPLINHNATDPLYQLPLRLGGQGMRSTVDISPIAYFSSVTNALFRLAPHDRHTADALAASRAAGPPAANAAVDGVLEPELEIVRDDAAEAGMSEWEDSGDEHLTDASSPSDREDARTPSPQPAPPPRRWTPERYHTPSPAHNNTSPSPHQYHQMRPRPPIQRPYTRPPTLHDRTTRTPA